MKKLAALLLLLLVSCATSAPPAADTETQKRAEATVATFEQMLAADPANAPIRYIAASGQAAAGRAVETAAHLSRLDAEGWTLGVRREDFKRIASDPAVRELLSRLEQKQPRVARSSPAFALREDDLMPEGIVFDATRGRFFVGSMRKRKIVSITGDGKIRDFVKSGEDGMLAVLGMKVDPVYELLWVASSGEDSAVGLSESEKGRSILYGIDLTSGGVRKKLPLKNPGQLNDLCVTSDGRVYVTDSRNGAIYTADRDSLDLETFLEPGKVQWVNGIVCDDANHRLYAAQFAGISAIDLRSRRIELLPVPKGALVGGIDGLSMYGRALIGIQNSFGSGRVIRMDLSEDGRSITTVKVLEAMNPEFHVPTTGTISGRNFVYIANSQLEMFPGGKRSPAFRPPLVFRLPLE